MPPAILGRFLREHRSEWVDSGIDAYAAAAVKAGPCTLPVDAICGHKMKFFVIVCYLHIPYSLLFNLN